MLNGSKYWNLIERVGIAKNVEISRKFVKSIKMLKLDRKGRNHLKCWNLSAKCQIDQAVAISVKVWNCLKCWNMSTKCQIDQNI